MRPKVLKSFNPSIPGTIALFFLAVVFSTLGLWQSERAVEKAITESQYRRAGPVEFESALAEKHRFAQIVVNGHYDPVRHILLDNKILNGHAGVHVFTPFYTLSGKAILVNRGWLPLGADRKILPDIPTPRHQTVLRGTLNTVPVPGRMLGPADKLKRTQWPQLVTYLNLENISNSLQVTLESWVVQLAKTEQSGFEDRHWRPVYLTSAKHKAYAFQWYALACVSVVLWVFNGFRKPKVHQL